MIQLYLGDGKGKTSAAIGAAIRMAGYEQKVLFSQFLKGGFTGELNMLNEIPFIEIKRNSRNYGFVKTLDDREKELLYNEQNKRLTDILDALQEDMYKMIVMDEIGDAVSLNTVDAELVKRIMISAKNSNTELVMTGHGEIDWMVEMSDYYSMIVKKKHPYDQGIVAREGIEY